MTSSSRTLSLSPAAREALLEHARTGAPQEVCGVLVGDRDALAVESIRRVENVAADPSRRYELDPEGALSAVDAVESAGVDVVGFYHSHPRGPAGPSETDRTEATWPGYVYAIVSLSGPSPTVGAWVWTGDAFAPLDVEVPGDAGSDGE